MLEKKLYRCMYQLLTQYDIENGVEKASVALVGFEKTQDLEPGESETLTVTEQLEEDLQDVVYDPSEYDAIEMPTLGADNGVKLYDMIGLDYNDPKWNDLLDQLTYDEMVALIGDSFHWTMPIESVNAPGTRDENGPQGLTVTLFGSSLGVETTALTSEDVMAATFNLDLIEEVGRVVGNDCVDANVSFLYGPGNNIHRTPYIRRNDGKCSKKFETI